MDTNMVLNASFNELVFENRHKEYGAYQIRKRYRKNVWLSVFVAVSFFSSAMILYMSNIPKAVAAVIPKSDSVKIIEYHVKQDDHQQKIKLPEQHQHIIPPPKGPDPVDPNNVTVTKDSVKVKSLIDSLATSSKGIVGGTGPVGPSGDPNPCTTCGDSTIHTHVTANWDSTAPPLDPGIDTFFKNNIKYPQFAKEGGIQGTVWLSFIVNYKGEIRDVKIIKSAHPWLDKEVLRVANLMPKWIPVKNADKSVEFIYRKPVRFTLQ